MRTATLSLPVLTADTFDDFVPFELYLPADLLRLVEQFAEDQDSNAGDWIASLVSAAVKGGAA